MNTDSPEVVPTFMNVKKWNKFGGSLICLGRVLLLLGAVIWSAFGDEVELRAGDIVQLRLLGDTATRQSKIEICPAPLKLGTMEQRIQFVKTRSPLRIRGSDPCIQSLCVASGCCGLLDSVQRLLV